MSTRLDSLLLVAGYSREFTHPCHIPIDIIRKINIFLYEYFPHIFAIKKRINSISIHEHGFSGIEYIDMHRKVSSHLNIFNVNTECFIKVAKDIWGVNDPGLAITHNFKIPLILRKSLPENVRESKNYINCSTAIFKVGGASSVIVIDHQSICNSEDINGYELKLPLPSYQSSQLAYHSSASTLYALFNSSAFSSTTFLMRLPFNICEETEEENSISALQWTMIADKRMQSYCSCDGSMICISSAMPNDSSDVLMFVNEQKAYLFPLEYSISNVDDAWIQIKDSNFKKECCGMCFDSIHNCVYAGCGIIGSWIEKKAKVDLYDFHKNEWYADIIPEIDVDHEIRVRPKFWIQDNLLFIVGGKEYIPNVIFVDLRENKKQWKVFDNQWSEYFVLRNEKQEPIVRIERIL